MTSRFADLEDGMNEHHDFARQSDIVLPYCPEGPVSHTASR